MSEHRDELVNLQERIEALESRLAIAPKAKLGPLVAVLLASWALAQTGANAGPGEQSIAPPSDDAIRKGPDGITRIDAPFQVVDAGGKVLLDVSADGNTGAAVSVSMHGGAGDVIVHASDGNPLVLIGRNNKGYGMLAVSDAQARPRAFVHGGLGMFQAVNEAGKQVATLAAIDGKGVVSVWGAGDGQRIAALTEGAAGAGELTVFDKGRKRVALITADPSGNGGLELFGAGKATAAVDLGINDSGGGQLALADSAGKSSAILTGNDSAGTGAVILAKDGKEAASLSVNPVGAGHLLLRNPEGGFGLDAAGASEKAPGRGGSMSVFNADGAVVAGIGTDEKGEGLVVVQEGPEFLVQLSRSTDTQGGVVMLRNAQGEMGVKATADTGGGGGVAVFNGTGDPVATLASSDNGKGSVTIFDKDHTVAEMNGATGTGYLFLSDAQGKISLDADGATGEFTTFNNGQVTASIGQASEGRGRVAAYAKNGAVAELAANQAGGGIVFVRNTTANVAVAGMSGTNNESGAVVVRDSTGATLAEISTTADKRGQVKVVNAAGTLLAAMAAAPGGNGGTLEVSNGNDIVASITAKSMGYGYLQLLNAGGGTIVEAGMTNGGLGAVMAGPGHRCPSGGSAQLAPTCIQGVAGK